MPRFVVTGTDTNIGTTVFSAALTRAIDAYYWKPVQAGLEWPTASERAVQLGVLNHRILDEAFRLRSPTSSCHAAWLEGADIEADRLTTIPAYDHLVIEAAGNAFAPLTRDILFADVFALWNLPVIVVSGTKPDSINRSLLSIDALKLRQVPIHGIAFVGDANEDGAAFLSQVTEVRRLGNLPKLSGLNASTLAGAFVSHFNIREFR